MTLDPETLGIGGVLRIEPGSFLHNMQAEGKECLLAFQPYHIDAYRLEHDHESGMPRILVLAQGIRTPYAREHIPGLRLSTLMPGCLEVRHPNYPLARLAWSVDTDRLEYRLMEPSEGMEPRRFVFHGNRPRNAAEQRLFDEYVAAVSRRVNDEMDQRITNFMVYGTTHPEVVEPVPNAEEGEGVTYPLRTVELLPPEVDYTQELADVPTIDEMWAKMEELGIMRDE